MYHFKPCFSLAVCRIHVAAAHLGNLAFLVRFVVGILFLCLFLSFSLFSFVYHFVLFFFSFVSGCMRGSGLILSAVMWPAHANTEQIWKIFPCNVFVVTLPLVGVEDSLSEWRR